MPILGLALLLSTAVACRPGPCQDRTDPLRGLLCETSSAVFDEAYWRSEAEADSPTWRKALAFCRKRSFPRATRCSLLARVDQDLTARREAEAVRQRLEQMVLDPEGLEGSASPPAPGPS